MKDANNQGKSFQERLAEAEEHWKNATISDIIAAMRREADSIEASARGSFKAGEDWDEMPFTESDLESAIDRAGTKRKEADRLEAALKREVDALNEQIADLRQQRDLWSKRSAELVEKCNEHYAKLKQVGDCAKLREAAEKTRATLEEALQILNGISDEEAGTLNARLEDVADEICEVTQWIIPAALAAPPRNCDIYATVEEARKVWCGKPSRDWDYLCDWLYALATEKEGGGDGKHP